MEVEAEEETEEEEDEEDVEVIIVVACEKTIGDGSFGGDAGAYISAGVRRCWEMRERAHDALHLG